MRFNVTYYNEKGDSITDYNVGGYTSPEHLIDDVDSYIEVNKSKHRVVKMYCLQPDGRTLLTIDIDDIEYYEVEEVKR